MALKSKLSALFANYIIKKRNNWVNQPLKTVDSDFKNLIKKGTKTAFGQDHDFENIKSYDDFKERVPIKAYKTALTHFLNSQKS